jgi:hypothetical protein
MEEYEAMPKKPLFVPENSISNVSHDHSVCPVPETINTKQDKKWKLKGRSSVRERLMMGGGGGFGVLNKMCKEKAYFMIPYECLFGGRVKKVVK